MERINIWDLWQKEWENASKFFQSKGNTKTLSKLKGKWYGEFKEMLMLVEEKTRENIKPKKSDNNDLIQFLEDLKVPHAPSNSPNKTEFHNGAIIMKDIILKKLKSLIERIKS